MQTNHQPQALTQANRSPSTGNSWSTPVEVREGGRGTGRYLSAIDRLYSRLDAMYLHKWRSYFTAPDVIEDWKKAWSTALVGAGVNFQMAFEGVERCRTEYPEWPPTEGQFIALCKPPMDYEQAFHDAVRALVKRRINDPADQPVWSRPAVYWAAVDFGQFELLQVSYGQAAARWKKLLDKRLQGECPDVPQYVPQLAAPARNADGVAITSAEAKASALEAMRSLASRKPSRELAATKAREVLARHEAGEKVLPVQLSHAREVLARLALATPDDDDPQI